LAKRIWRITATSQSVCLPSGKVRNHDYTANDKERDNIDYEWHGCERDQRRKDNPAK
jgi:hypothetical protein